MAFVFLCLACFTDLRTSSSISVATNDRILLFFYNNNILLYKIYHICVHLLKNIWVDIISLKAENVSPATLLFLLKFILDILGSVHGYVYFRISLLVSFPKELVWSLILSKSNLRKMAVMTIPWTWHNLSFNFSSLFCLENFRGFQKADYLLNFHCVFLGTFIFWGAVLNSMDTIYT